MSSKNPHTWLAAATARALPLLMLALLAIGTAVQVGCTAADVSDDTTSEDELNNQHGYGHRGYGYANHNKN
jgi:hypothetical protein